MADAPRSLIAGNWKMNGLQAGAFTLAADIAARAGSAGPPGREIVLCPPSVLIGAVVAAVDGAIAVGGQDCHEAEKGAHTGDLSAEMLADAGCAYVIAGHSERRTGHGESDNTVHAKAAAAHRAGLTAIVCVGETQAERAAGGALEVVARQVAGSVPDGASAANTVIAYEPVWAIGSGHTPSMAEVGEVHRHVRGCLVGLVEDAARVRLLYGGSVNPGNAAELLAADEVNGALVGGASLDAAALWSIVTAQ
jgi:triosephosphate isomerase